jgi:hypothetical protein
MDDIIKLLQQLMSQKPRPKGGIADTAEGVEFLGKTLSKEQRGNFMVVNSRLTDASRLEPFSISNVGKDKRFNLISDYEKDLLNEFNRTVEFLKANPDIRLSQTQKDNIYYNLGVYRRITAEKNKLEKSIIEDGKKPSNVLDMEGTVLDPAEPIIGGKQDPITTFRLNVDKFKEDFNVPDEEIEKILALSPEEQQKVLQDYINKDFKERIELSDFDVTDKEPNAKGGRVGFSQGTPGRGLGSLTPQQKFYTDKLIRDNMEAIREDMSLYFDEDDRTEFQKFLDSLTKKDIYGTYDEKKGYDSVFKEYFETRDGKNFVFEGPGDNEIDRKGLLELIDKSTRPRTFDYDVTKKQRKEFEI